MELTIKPLTPELITDYLYFFDNMVFTENPDWSKCYCYSFHFVGPDEKWNKKDNRAAVTKMIKEGSMKGYLAFLENKPIGWCNVNDRNNYQRLLKIYELKKNATDKVCSVVCFLISPDFRKQGIAKMFLNRIIEDYSGKGFDCLEAYPDKSGFSCENNYKGPLSLYEKNNFEIISEHEKYYVVQRELK